MADSVLNITVTTQDSQLLELIRKLNAGNLSISEQAKLLREYKSNIIAGTQAQRDFNDILAQATQRGKSAEAQERGLGAVIRQSRQERRLYMFAVTESLQAVNAATGGQNELAKSVSAGAGAYFGMKFALDAAGGSLAAMSLPLSITIAAWTVFNTIGNQVEQVIKKLNAAIQKNTELLVASGKISKESFIGMLTKQLNTREAEKITPDLGASILGREAMLADALTKIIEKQNDELEIIAKRKEVEKGLTEDEKNRLEKQKAAIITLGEINEQRYKNGEISAVRFSVLLEKEINDYSKLITSAEDLKTIEQLKSKAQDEHKKRIDAYMKTAEEANQRQEEMGNANLLQLAKIQAAEKAEEEQRRRLTGKTNVAGLDVFQGGSSDQNFLERQKTVLDVMEGKTKQEAERTAQLTQPIVQGFNAVGSSIQTNIVDKLITTNNLLSGIAKQLLGAIIQVGLNFFSGGIAGWLGLASGGDVSYGGALRFAATGGNYNYGRLQNVIVGERGPELMQVGMNGVRVISNQRMGEINRMSGGGMSGGYSMKPYVQVIPISDNRGLSIRVEVGNRLNTAYRR